MSQESSFRLDQKRESAPQAGENAFLGYRYAYARAADSRRDDEPGQDYLAFRDGADHFVFAVCDGVGQSFYGDLAARLLGDALVDWLETGPPVADHPAALVDSLPAFLSALTATAAERVDQYPIPDGPPLLREVLLEKQARGSEAMFVCGRVDAPGPARPNGRVLLAWMGDMRVYLWRGDRPVDLGGVHETDQRWSSRRGPVGGAVNLYHGPLTDTQGEPVRLVAYSDGLKVLDKWANLRLTDVGLQRAIDHSNSLPDSDDLVYLELTTHSAQPATQPRPAAPAQQAPSTRRPMAPLPRPEPQPVPPPAAPVPAIEQPARAAAVVRRAPRWPIVAGGLGLLVLCGILWLVLRPTIQGRLVPILSGLLGLNEAAPTPTPTAASTLVPTAIPPIAPTSVPTAIPPVAPTSVPTAIPPVAPPATPASVPTIAPPATPPGVDVRAVSNISMR